MIHTAYSSIHTHVSSLIPRMCYSGLCDPHRIIRVLLRVMYDPHSLFIYSHTCLQSDSPDDVQDNHGATRGYVRSTQPIHLFTHMSLV